MRCPCVDNVDNYRLAKMESTAKRDELRNVQRLKPTSNLAQGPLHGSGVLEVLAALADREVPVSSQSIFIPKVSIGIFLRFFLQCYASIRTRALAYFRPCRRSYSTSAGKSLDFAAATASLSQRSFSV